MMSRINAAGVLFLTVDKKALFLQRSAESDMPGIWAFPGGKIEEGETPEQAAERECIEEIGKFPEGKLIKHTRRIAHQLGDEHNQSYDVDFTTYLMCIEKEFKPKLNDEHTAYVWAPVNTPPQPIHPGVGIAISKLSMNELDIARAMIVGELTSPQWYENIALYDIRITGTGVAYRRALDEFTFRDPNIYLNQNFLDRCNGLPVILEHPSTNSLNTKEYSDRNVGSVFIPYIKGDEVWAICKIWDRPTAKYMENNQLSTSPAVVFRDPDVNTELKLEDGTAFLIEGNPSLLDHVAICEVGVWDKGGDPKGIITEGIIEMAKEEEVKKDAMEEEAKKDAAAKADAEAGQKLDKILAHLDSVSTKVDSFGSRLDALEKQEKDEPKKDAAKKDNEKEMEKSKHNIDDSEKAKKDAEEKEEKAKKDAEEKEEKAKKDAAVKKDREEDEKSSSKEDSTRRDSDLTKRIADLESKLPKNMSDSDFKTLSDTQARADRVFNFLGKSAPRFLNGETNEAYRRRLASELQPHSKEMSKIDLHKISQPEAFDILETKIYADAEYAGLHPSDVASDTLREIVTVDRTTGRRMITFAGQPKSWMNDYAHVSQRARINRYPDKQ
jgi:8-oxo-dGTP pyrophosphatase MutT (NUDIX family)/outer membrane biosynthesis protein TonB